MPEVRGERRRQAVRGGALRAHQARQPQVRDARDEPTRLTLARFPLLVRECGGITPTLTGRLGFGREVTVDLNGKSADEVYLALAGLETS